VSDHQHAKHRSTPARTTRPLWRRTGSVLTIALAATGLVVTVGLLSGSAPAVQGAAASLSAAGPVSGISQDELDEREERASRSTDDRRPPADAAKERTLSNASGVARTRTEDLSDADPRTLAKALLPQYGMSAAEFGCLDDIWVQESGWDIHAANPTSSAYGIPQALPGSKMSSAGPNWEDNPETQIRWGLGYIRDRYGSACSALSFKNGAGWY